MVTLAGGFAGECHLISGDYRKLVVRNTSVRATLEFLCVPQCPQWWINSVCRDGKDIEVFQALGFSCHDIEALNDLAFPLRIGNNAENKRR